MRLDGLGLGHDILPRARCTSRPHHLPLPAQYIRLPAAPAPRRASPPTNIRALHTLVVVSPDSGPGGVRSPSANILRAKENKASVRTRRVRRLIAFRLRDRLLQMAALARRNGSYVPHLRIVSRYLPLATPGCCPWNPWMNIFLRIVQSTRYSSNHLSKTAAASQRMPVRLTPSL